MIERVHSGAQQLGKEEDLKNTKEVVVEFKERINTEVRRQEKLDIAEERDFRKGELPGKYTAKILYSQNDGKFENKYLRKLERNWEKWKGKDKTIQGERTSFSGEEISKEGNVRIINNELYFYFIFIQSQDLA